MEKIKNLKATTQASYYGKAKIIETETEKLLKSYETIVCKIDACGNFVKLWDGYSRTTINHINDFRTQNGFDRLNKKEWLQLKTGNGKTENAERYKIEFSNGFISWKSELMFDNYFDAERYAEKVITENTRIICYGIDAA